ncbi:N-acetylmuramoyl-L-alanine amidase, partial [Parabacteroides sp. OttesenSCG-928-N08]|nr:N-acetylmuramoyl-L-alanine amidase [Parabacteroides sp. OttesenSCG-928-N08]
MKTKLIHLLRLFLFALFVVGTTAAQEKVQPQKGDGILSLLRRYQREGAEYEQAFIELNKGRLGKNNSLLLDRSYLLPPLQATPEQASKESTTPAASISSQAAERKGNHEPLFGKQLADYRITSSDLKGACFYVVSGHGGPDPGAVGKIGNHTLHEDEYAYDIALRLARCLLMRGATVHIIIQDKEDGIRDDQILQNSKRETCMGSAIPLNQTERLRQRSEKINALYNRDKPQYSRAIFLH